MAKQKSPDAIMQLGLGFWASKTLLSAIELGVFTHLNGTSLEERALARKLRLHRRSARDFFDALVALGMLNRDGSRYSNTPETSTYLDQNKPSYIGGVLEMANARLYPAWGSLTEGLRTGKPQNETKHGKDPFASMYARPERLRQFLQAMTGISLPSARALAEKFPWHLHDTFVDIGCAQGCVPVQLAQAHPHLSGAGFDLPVVGPVFKEYVTGFKLQKRIQFVPGNMFNGELPTADVLIMGHILHDWDLRAKRKLLRKAYDALPRGGALIVYEALIDDQRRTSAFGLLMSLNMLIETPGGFDYTGADCKGWMKETGFCKTRVEHLTGPDSMVIGIK